MTKRIFTRLPVALASLFTALTLAACGGGSGGDTSTAQDSSACFNAGLYRSGTVITYAYKDVESSAEYRVSAVQRPEGTNPPLAQISDGSLFHKRYYSVEQNTLLEHAEAWRYYSIDYAPALQHPISMQPGNSTTQNFVGNRLDYLGPPVSTKLDITFTKTYLGREVIQTALGSFETCKFTTTYTATHQSTPIYTTENTITEWVSATQQYRGFPLKMEQSSKDASGTVRASSAEVSRITQFNIQ